MIDLSVLFPKQKIYCYSSEQLVETCKTLYHYQKNKSHSAFEMGASHLEKMLYNILHSSTIEKAAIWEEFPIKKACDIYVVNHKSDDKLNCLCEFLVVYDTKIIKSMLDKSWLKVDLNLFMQAIIIAETISFVSYYEVVSKGQLDKIFNYGKQSQMKCIIDEIFRAIYPQMLFFNFSEQYPEIAKYITIYNAVIRKKPFESMQENFDEDGTMLFNGKICRNEELLEKLLQYIYDFAQNGIIKVNNDITEQEIYQNFVNSAMGYILVAKRGNVNDVVDACIAIANMLLNIQDKELQDKINTRHEMKNNLNCNLSFVSNGFFKEDAFNEKLCMLNHDSKASYMSGALQSDIVDKSTAAFLKKQIAGKEALNNLKEKVKAYNNGMKASCGDSDIPQNNMTGFFNKVIRENAKQIFKMEQLFRKVFTKMKSVNFFDGDVNLMKQQEAYLASITKEDAKVYQYYKLKKVDVDVVILRDVSGSTVPFMTQYAKVTCMFLAAVNNIPGIRTMQIDFADKAKVNKRFEEQIEMATVGPIAAGGTQLMPALNELKNVKFKGKLKLMFIISDGEIYDNTQAEATLNELRKQGMEVIKYAIGNYHKNDYKNIKIDEIDKEITNEILERRLVKYENMLSS